MKRIIFLLALVAGFGLSSYAQLTTPYTGTLSSYTQLWNTGSVYYNTVTLQTQLGAQLDTVVNVASLNLVTSNFWFSTNGNPATFVYPPSINGVKAFVNIDTVIVAPLDGWGQVTLTNAIYKCTGTDTVLVTPISSSDGSIWAPIPGATVATVTPTSLTVPVVTKWNFATKPDRYIGTQVSNQKTSSTISTRSWIYFLKPQTINIK